MTLVPDFDRFSVAPSQAPGLLRSGVGRSRLFRLAKLCADVGGALVMLPLIAVLAVLLTGLNPLINPGPLLFRQARMGQNGRTFKALKFRTMAYAPDHRGPLDPVETDRIPRLGRLLRRTGLDELPQAINILRGEMSLIGPRPDCVRHARIFLETIPEYRQRLSVRPGISGFAQITLGYAVGLEATREKVQADLDYITRAGFALDLWITWRTILNVALARGD
ncbi:sugar transferase [Gymnodinialimonas ulvae]|uniref:sugar transferase n=1 Tax=Gymnodinialimonas ulvae TaxID=3126504 RepID=UPI0030ACADA5